MRTHDRHVLEKLQAVNPRAEIWWDSAPMVYAAWAERVVAAAPPEKRDRWRGQLARLFNPEAPERGLFRGVTTNPPLSLAALRQDLSRWTGIVRAFIREDASQDVEAVYWRTYREIIRQGAQVMRPLWVASGGRFGFLCAQVDPRDCFDAERMLAQGLDLAALAPNLLIKVPGTREGYRVIEELAARGVGVNNTLSFTVPQFAACLDALERGLARARKSGIDLSRFRSVITHMSGRYGRLGDLAAQAEARGISLEEADLRWAEITIFQRAYRLVCARGLPVKLLISSMCIGPCTGPGAGASWHIEKTAGADVVYACPPPFIEALMAIEDDLGPFRPDAMEEEAPAETLAKLRRLPYFQEAIEPDGLKPEQFNRHAALVATAAEFARATRHTVDFIAQQFEALRAG